MNMSSGYQAYQKNKYETASPHRLIVLLYEGAIRFATQANHFIEEKNIEKKNEFILKFQDVIYELISSLNFKEGKEVAENLYSLYSYIIELSNKGNLTLETKYLNEAITIISEIKEAWVSVGKDVSVNG